MELAQDSIEPVGPIVHSLDSGIELRASAFQNILGLDNYLRNATPGKQLTYTHVNRCKLLEERQRHVRDLDFSRRDKLFKRQVDQLDTSDKQDQVNSD